MNKLQFVFLFLILLSLVGALYLTKNFHSLRAKAEGNSTSGDREFSIISPLETKPVSSLKISGLVTLNKANSYVRVVLVDSQKNEYLVYETYPLVTSSQSFTITDTCEETCVLSNIAPNYLKIEGFAGSFDLSKTTTSTVSNRNSQATIDAQTKSIKADKDNAKIRTLNINIRKKGLKWVAGETEFSKLTYAQKQKLFPNSKVPALHGFEYYKGGVFEFATDSLITSATSTPSRTSVPTNPKYPRTWDWRNRHGINWITPVKSQLSCGGCWAFSAVATFEATTNLYYNQQLNLDFSEQDVISCSKAGSCQVGGLPYFALDYFRSAGAVSESCFPYVATDVPCSNKCADWKTQTVKATWIDRINVTEDEIKKAIITKGILSVDNAIPAHSMALIGWDTDMADGKPIWILKNSWGGYWGEQGYARIKIPVSSLSGIWSLRTPITIENQTRAISCTDNDSDDYCNWGISETKPASCSSSCKPEKDCNDSNANYGPYSSSYNCQAITHAECYLGKCISVAGAGINACRLNYPCAKEITHAECVSGRCVKVSGLGINQCSLSTDCRTPRHAECVKGKCILVNGAGANKCQSYRNCLLTVPTETKIR